MSGISDPVPDSLRKLEGFFEMAVSWGDPALAEDDDAKRRLVVAGYELGAQRAKVLGREMRAIDVEYGLAILCKWPLKPETSSARQQQIERFRTDFVPFASEGRPFPIDPTFLTLSLEQLYQVLEAEDPPLGAL